MNKKNITMFDKRNILIVFILICNYSFSQYALRFPREFSKPDSINQNPFEIIKFSEKKYLWETGYEPWVVLSDRDNNTFYNRNGDSTGCLNFLDQCIVLRSSFEDINSERLNLVRVSKDIDTNTYNNVNLGESFWVPWENLIINPNSLIINHTGIRKKIMTLFKFEGNGIENNGDIKCKFFGKNIQYYREPNENNLIGNYQKEIDYQLRFVYKKEGDFVLVGVEDSSEYLRINNKIKNNNKFGWIHKMHQIPWNHRVAWEINYNKNQSNHNRDTIICYTPPKQDKVGCILFKNKSDAELYYELGVIKKYCEFSEDEIINLEVDNFYDRRIPGICNRFPLLDVNFPNDCVVDSLPTKVGAVKLIKEEEGNKFQKIIDEKKFHELRQEVRDICNNRKTINMIFIIDATNSITSYNVNISAAIKEALLEIHKRSDFGKVFQIGVVLYRDEEETTPFHIRDSLICFQDNEDLGEFNLKLDSICGWIERNMSNDYNISDNTDSEALYKAIEKAIDKYGHDIYKFQSNYLIMIGDAGDHKDNTRDFYVDEEGLINAIASKNFSIIGCQVTRPDTVGRYAAYREWEDQIRKLILRSAHVIYSHTSNTAHNIPHQLICDSKDSTIFKIHPNELVMSTYKACKLGDTLKPETLQMFIRNSIKQINAHVNIMISDISKMGFDKSAKISPYTAKIIYTLLKREILWKDFKSFLEETRYLYHEVYAIYKGKGHKFPYYKTVIFVESDYLYKLDHSIKELNAAYKRIDKSSLKNNQIDQIRNPILSFMSIIYEGVLGYSNTKSEDLKFGELLNCICEKDMNLEQLNVSINEVSIMHIDDAYDLLATIVCTFNISDKKIENLKNIYERKNNYYGGRVWDNNTQVDHYFWIPMELILN